MGCPPPPPLGWVVFAPTGILPLVTPTSTLVTSTLVAPRVSSVVILVTLVTVVTLVAVIWVALSDVAETQVDRLLQAELSVK